MLNLQRALLLFTPFVRGAEWVIDNSVDDLVLMGLGVADATHAVAGTCSSTGAEPSFWMNGTGWKFTHNSPSGVISDIASLPGNEVAVYSTFGGPFLSTDQGASWSHVSDAAGLSQSVQAFNGDSFGLVGQLSTKENGTFGAVITSTNGKGTDWNYYAVDGANYLRYGDYPSSTTWYITEGTWPSSSLDSSPFLHAFPNSESGFEMTSNVHVGKIDHAKVASSNKDANGNGYLANIYKTTDGGKTFSKVFESTSTDQFYFNAISCGSETNCVAVAEGEVTANKVIQHTTFAYMTSDGGASWSKVFDGGYTYMSIIPVKMISETEGWMGPSGYLPGSKTQVVTDFMFTSDGGATWTIDQSLEDCISTYIDSSDGLSMSTCLKLGGVSSRVAIYQ